METIKQVPERIVGYLEKRGINRSVLSSSGIGWTGTHISIPIKNQNDEVIFYKFRRDPESNDGPKYSYEKGATSELYIPNRHWFKTADPVFICEGELDCLVMNSNGFCAVSSTGGSGTFKPEWANEFLHKRVFICYDNDDAGYRGAFRLQAEMPWAKIVWIPKVKDVTDWFMAGGTTQAFVDLYSKAESYYVPKPLTVLPEKKSQLSKIIKEDSLYVNTVVKKIGELKQLNLPSRHLDVLREYLLNRIQSHKKMLKTFGRRFNEQADIERIKRAKAVPIPTLMPFNSQMMARCIWHNESSPSLHYYEKKNIVHCFGCGTSHDSIDVVRQQKGIGIKEAIDYLIKK